MLDVRGQLPTRTGARPYYSRDLGGIVGATIHYTASGVMGTVESIAAYQTGPGPADPFPSIAYSLIVDYAGTVYRCHDLETRCWHSGAVVNGIARNSSHVGICYIGDYAPNKPQVQGLAYAVAWCERQLGRRLGVEGHRSVYPTACPGPIWESWRPELLMLIETYR